MSLLFSEYHLGELVLPNRIIIPPMCQYQAEAGQISPWHLIHYGQLAMSGAGMLILEATAVEERGRISKYDLGLWSDEVAAGLGELLRAIRKYSKMPMAVQLGHAGRKAGQVRPWEGDRQLTVEEGGWTALAPSAVAWPGWQQPQALDEAGIVQVKEAFVQAAKRADAQGFDCIELHAAHGYLLHQFLSPLTNQRTDAYGGSLGNRLRLCLEIFELIRAGFASHKPVGVRISATDWIAGGWDLPESLILTDELAKRGCSFIHVSSGGLAPEQKITPAPGYQVYLASRIKEAVGLPTIAVGLITEPEQAETIVQSQQADMVGIGRAILYNPHWPWACAAHLKAKVSAPPSYWRSCPRLVKDLFNS